MATPGGTPPSGCWVWFGEVLHGGTYHQDWRIETTRRRPPRSGSAALSWPWPRLVAAEWPWRLARVGATGPAPTLLLPPEHA